MKSLFHSLLLAFATTGFLACSVSPSPSVSSLYQAEDAGEIALAYDSVVYADSILDGDHVAAVSLLAYYPTTQGDVLSDSIRMWVCSQFGDSTGVNLRNPAAALKAYAKAQFEGEFGESLKDFAESTFDVRMSDEIEVRPLYEDAEVVTFGSQRFVYLGGAHGSTLCDNATFSREDGRILGWELLKDMTREEIVAAIKAGLREYFQVDNDAALVEELLIGEPFDEADRQRVFDTDFPLPAIAPWRDAEGIHILYQQYEIAPYAAGMPGCIIRR